jgi:hypothetical protein
VLEVGQDLHNLPQVLRVKPLDEGSANDVGQELVQRLGPKLDASLHVGFGRADIPF